MYKIIIAGGRDFKDYNLLCESCDEFFKEWHPNIVTVNGGARGSDRLGGKYSINKGYLIKPFPADWERFGRAAGVIRNEEMAQYADAAIVFWDGKSVGSKSMIDLAKSNGLNVMVVRYDE